MGTENIRFNLGSGFDGSGFDRARSAVSGANASMASAGKEANRMGESFGKVIKGLDSTGGMMGSTAEKVKNVIGGALSGGIWGIAIAGVAAVASAWISWRKEIEETKKKQDEVLLALAKQKLTNQVNDLAKQHSDAVAAIDKQIKSVRDLASAYDTLAKSEADQSNAEDDKNIALLEGRKSNIPADDKSFEAAQKRLDIEREINDIKAAAVTRTNQYATLEAEEKVKLAIQELNSEIAKVATNKDFAAQAKNMMDTTRWGTGAGGNLKTLQGVVEKATQGADTTGVETSRMKLVAANNALAAAQAKAAAAVTRQQIAGNALADAQEKLTASVREYQMGLDRSERLRQQIAIAEDKIIKKAQAVDNLRIVVSSQTQTINSAKSTGAAQWTGERQKKRDDALETLRETQREEKSVENIRSRMRNGTRVSERDRQRVQDFDEWTQLRNKGGAKQEDALTTAQKQLSAMQENLTEVKALRREIISKLGVK